MTDPEGNGAVCFPRISMFPREEQKESLKNALRIQRQHQATSDHVQQRSTFQGNIHFQLDIELNTRR